MDATQQRPSHASYHPDGGPPPQPPLLYPLDPRPRSADYAPGPPAVPAVPPMGSASSPHPFDYAPSSSSSAHQHHHAHHHHQHHHQPQRSYINPLLPPGVDPSQVDFRTFHPYMPNEVKHRKRTSRAQFKVLEETFERFTKPNQELRKQLSAQLDMTPRAVQVWFQNRRAKEKNMKKKHQQGSRDKLSPAPEEGDEDSPSANGHTASSTDTNGAGPSGDASPSSPSSPLTPGSSPTHAESASPRIPLIEQVPLPPSSAEPSPLTGTHPWPTADAAADPLLHLRRGSLPVGVGYGGGSHHDPHGRRRSIDTGLSRLARHPYASIARAANHSALSSRASFAAPSSAPNHLSPPYDAAGTYLHPGMHHQPHHYHHQPPAHYPYPPAHYAPGLHAHRPVLMHRASMPHALNVYGALAGGFSHHRGSVDSSASPLATDVPVLAPPRSALSSRTRLLDESPLTISTRSVSSPIPGPLPSPTFVFGAAGGGMPAPAEEDEALHAELSTFAFPAPTSGGADGTSSSPSIPPGSAGSASSGSATGSNPPSAMGFDAHPHYAFDSRYGSIASVAESEASSAYFSDTSGACFDDPSAVSGERKASFATNGLFDMFGHLHVEAANLAPRELGPMEAAPTQQQQSTPPSVTTTGMAMSGTYHSPDSASTVSPGASPASPPHGEDGVVRAAMAAPPITLQISRESELTYALSPEQQGVVASAVVHTPPYNSTSASPHASAAYLAHPYATTTHVPSPPSAGVVISGGGPYDTTGMYSDPSSSNPSSLNLPLSGVAGGHQGEFKSAEMSAFALGQPPQTAVSPVVDMSYGLMSFH